ncbi:MAG: acetate kinase [Bacteroidota bacterium]
MQNRVLVINSGSSSIKFSLIGVADKSLVCSGLAEKLGMDGACLHTSYLSEKQTVLLPIGSHEDAMHAILQFLQYHQLPGNIAAVGHRVVHGGEFFKSSTLITEPVLEAIRKCVPFAPLHNPANLAGIEAAITAMPSLPQVAVFDTAFHQTLPSHAFRYALPQTFYTDYGVRRYGFHGTSHQYVSMEAAKLLNIPLEDSAFITAHLGNGASASAILNGKSVDTSMGFTPLEGLVMGTRSGDVDPGLHAYLAGALRINVVEVENLLNKKSGLLGLSGLSADMRELQQAADNGHEASMLAIEVFVFRLAKYIASLSVSLPRVDALIFTGGIGENAYKVRAKTLERLAVLGYKVDNAANIKATRGKPGIISEEGSTRVLVINTNEELMIALETIRVVAAIEAPAIN